MNSSRPFTRTAQKTFRAPLDFLNNLSRGTGQSPRGSKKSDSYKARRHNSQSSLDDTDHSDVEQYARMESSRRSHSTHNSQSELQPAVPLIDIGSRSNSPYPRNRSAAQSEDEEDDYGPVSSIRPLVSHNMGKGNHAWRGFWRQGGPGAFFFGTWIGWQVWIGLLVFWVGGCQFGLLLMNRFIMLTGIYKFPYPLSQTYIQLLITHLLLVVISSLLRFLTGFLHFIGFGVAVPPSQPAAPQGGAYRGSRKPGISAFARWLSNGSGGIAGGGLFEFDWQIAKQVLPLAVVFVVKVLLSNYSFAYAPLPIYQLARIGVTPLAIIFSCILQKENLSGSSLSAALIATLNLSFASYRSSVRVTWESVVAGVFSSLFVALYPILLLRTYRTLVAGLVPQGDVLTGYPSSAEEPGNREETRAYYRTLHYTSLLSLMLLTPIVLISGQFKHIYHNIPFLDVPFFWAMMLFGGMGSWAVFSGTLLLVKATSPLTTTFITIPRSAFQLAMISLFKIPAQSWVGVILCWISSVWFLVVRRDEGRSRNRLRLEGR
ncbi:Nn.00g043750.m01.CDS01 [Neocucurbitaria sp. VM-36]